MKTIKRFCIEITGERAKRIAFDSAEEREAWLTNNATYFNDIKMYLSDYNNDEIAVYETDEAEERETWKSVKKEYLAYFYGKKAEEWKDERDDRKVFSNIYYQIIEAIDSLDDEPKPYVCVALDNHIKEDEEMLRRILKHFEK